MHAQLNRINKPKNFLKPALWSTGTGLPASLRFPLFDSNLSCPLPLPVDLRLVRFAGGVTSSDSSGRGFLVCLLFGFGLAFSFSTFAFAFAFALHLGVALALALREGFSCLGKSSAAVSPPAPSSSKSSTTSCCLCFPLPLPRPAPFPPLPLAWEARKLRCCSRVKGGPGPSSIVSSGCSFCWRAKGEPCSVGSGCSPNTKVLALRILGGSWQWCPKRMFIYNQFPKHIIPTKKKNEGLTKHSSSPLPSGCGGSPGTSSCGPTRTSAGSSRCSTCQKEKIRGKNISRDHGRGDQTQVYNYYKNYRL